MSSSRRGERDRSKGDAVTRGSSQLPTQWSDWEWHDESNCRRRYRLDSRGEYDIQYDKRTPRNPDADPPMSLSSIQESPQTQENPLANYTTSVSGLTSALAATNLGGSTFGQPTSYAAPSTTASWGNSGPQRPPPISSQNPRWISTRNRQSDSENLDPRFKVHRSKDFKFGEVFKVLWSEPTGNGGTEITTRSQAKYGQTAHHKIRRFVVIKNKQGHCTCIPILTYGGQGTLKHGVHPDDHAIIYSSRHDGPKLLEHEKLKKKPIRMNPVDESHKLDPTSRLNYAKLYTVEHNVKVWFIGRIAQSSQQQLTTDFNSTNGPVPNPPPHSGRSSPDLDYSDTNFTGGADPPYPGAQAIPSSSSSHPVGSYSGSYLGSRGFSTISSNSYQDSNPVTRTFSNSSSQSIPVGSYQSQASMATNYPSSSSYHPPPSTYFPATSSLQDYGKASLGSGYAAPTSSSTSVYTPISTSQATYSVPVVSSTTYRTRPRSPGEESQSRSGRRERSTGPQK